MQEVVTDSPLFVDDILNPDFEAMPDDMSETLADDPGAIIDGQIVNEPSEQETRTRTNERPSLLSGYEERESSDEPKSGPPKVDEWLDFFSRIVLRVATDWYVSLAFRGIDEDALSDQEINAARMSKDERNHIARPFAEFTNKSKFARKHGRMILSSADSIDSLYVLALWAARVNRIARRHQPRRRVRERSRQNSQNGHGRRAEESAGPFIFNPGSG